MALDTNSTDSRENTADLRQLREGFALIKHCEALCDSGRLDEAYQLLSHGLTLLPHNADYQSACACLLCELGYYEKALVICDAVLTDNGHCPAAVWWKAYALFRLERPSEALVAFDILLAQSPQYPNANWMRAITLHKLRGERAAIVMEAYDRAATDDPKNPYVLAERADILRVNGRYEEARNTYATIRLPSFCDDAALRIEAAFKLGCVALVLNEIETSRTAFQEVLELDPDYPDARAMYNFVDQS